jgi:hypothetical protein
MTRSREHFGWLLLVLVCGRGSHTNNTKHENPKYMRMNNFGMGLFALGAVCVIGFAESSRAQGTLNLTATISDVQNGGLYDYTVVLTDPAGSASAETFWFGWTFSGNHLVSEPSDIVSPSAWSSSITTGPGFAIEWTTSTPLTAGQSLTFQFASPDSPTVMAANDESYGFGGAAFSMPEQEFAPNQVPEPSTFGLMATGLVGLSGWLARRRSGA